MRLKFSDRKFCCAELSANGCSGGSQLFSLQNCGKVSITDTLLVIQWMPSGPPWSTTASPRATAGTPPWPPCSSPLWLSSSSATQPGFCSISTKQFRWNGYKNYLCPKICYIQMVQYGTIKSWPWWADNLSRWNHLMLVVNSSINIVIYTAKVMI